MPDTTCAHTKYLALNTPACGDCGARLRHWWPHEWLLWSFLPFFWRGFFHLYADASCLFGRHMIGHSPGDRFCRNCGKDLERD